MVAVLALALGGCCRSAPPSTFPTADDALERMKATYQCANGIKGEGKIDHFSPKGRIRGQVYVFAINPARVRFDVVSTFGTTVYTLTSNGRTFRMLDVERKEFLHGPASACNLARLTQVPVPGHVLVALLRGEASVLAHQPEDATIEWDCDGYYRVVIRGKHEATQEIHLEVYDDDFEAPWEQQRLRVTEVITSQQGTVLFRAELRRHEPAVTSGPREDPDGIDDPIPPSGGPCDVEVPRAIRMRVPNTDDDVIFQYKKVKFNPPIPDGAFDQPVPGGVRQIRVTCEGR